MQLNDSELLEYIREDLPYFDLTTHLLNVPTKEMTLSISTRDNDENSFKEALQNIKKHSIEKKLTVESETIEDAKELLHLGVDVLQMDKCSIDVLEEIVAYKNTHFPHANILATGGVNISNVVKYAKTGVNAIVTSSLYNTKMADLTSSLSNK